MKRKAYVIFSLVEKTSPAAWRFFINLGTSVSDIRNIQSKNPQKVVFAELSGPQFRHFSFFRFAEMKPRNQSKVSFNMEERNFGI